MPKVIICDWDGTVVDSVPTILSCKQALAKNHGLAMPDEALIREALGMPLHQALKHCFPDSDKEAVLQLAQEFHEEMKKDENQAYLFPVALDVLSSLKEQGYVLAIATSKDRGELESALEYHNIQQLFSMVCCSSDSENKPNPKMLQDIMKHFDVDAVSCTMLGDTLRDMLFAQNAHVKPIFVTFGAGDASDLENTALQNKPHLANSWQEILTLVNDLLPA